MIKYMYDEEDANIIVSTEAELPIKTSFGAIALIIETGELKIFDGEWKSF